MVFKIFSSPSPSSCTEGLGECGALMPCPPPPSAFDRQLPPTLPPDIAASQLGSCSLLLLNLPSSPLGTSRPPPATQTAPPSSSSSSPLLPKVGLDCALWTIGPNFSGVKCIQPGCHFLYSLLPSSSSSSLPRGTVEGQADAQGTGGRDEEQPTAFECLYTSMKVDDVVGECLENTQRGIRGEFIFFPPHCVVVRRWHPSRMRFEKLKDEDEEERYIRAVKRLEMDRHLGVYPQQYVRMWSVLTDWISRPCIERLEPLEKIFSPWCQPLTSKEEELLSSRKSPRDRMPASSSSSSSSSLSTSRTKERQEVEAKEKQNRGDAAAQSSSADGCRLLDGEVRERTEEAKTSQGRARREEEKEKEEAEADNDNREGEDTDDYEFSSEPGRFYFADIPSIQKTAIAIARRSQLHAKRQGASPEEAMQAASRVLTSEAMDGSASLLALLEQIQEDLNLREGEVQEEEEEEGEAEEDEETEGSEKGQGTREEKTKTDTGAQSPSPMEADEEEEEEMDTEGDNARGRSRTAGQDERIKRGKGVELYLTLIEEEKERWRKIRRRTWQNLLGELQLSYVAFLLAHRYDAFEQWKKLLELLCQSERAVYRLPEMYLSLIRVVYCQLEQCPSEFLEDALLQKSFLTSSALSLVVICMDLLPGEGTEEDQLHARRSAAVRTRAGTTEDSRHTHPRRPGQRGAEGEGEEEPPRVEKRKKKQREAKRQLLRQVEERAGWLKQLLQRIVPRPHERGDRACQEFVRNADASLLFLDEEDQPVVVDEKELERAGVSLDG